ncbi:MAG TPA: helix-turn-helix transcriptional regulator [Firmicutes bacterium]|nr:helix-turn-helix transcriptional regulator [Bacillota bacterium]
MASKFREPHYYSDRLRRKLNGLCSARTTVVEALSGYGKTTAIRDFFAARPAKSEPVFWFTATGETPAAGFERLCLTIARIDSQAGNRLLAIGLPDAATIGEAGDALRSIDCTHQTYLVIDNYQHLQAALPPAFLGALLEHGGEGLHIIIITQPLKDYLPNENTSRDFLHITAADLRLDAADIQRYYSQAGLSLTPEEAKTVECSTGGWIIAVHLQLRAFRETGVFCDRTVVLDLLEHLVWERLTAAQQALLLRLSPFTVVTMQQVGDLSGCDETPEYAWAALDCPFVHFDPAGRRYEFHRVFTDLLAKKRAERGSAFECECWSRAGDYCRNKGETAQALDFYFRIGDYEKMLSLDLAKLILERIGTVPFAQIASRIAANCPPETKKRHPLSLLQIAWALLTAGMDEEYGALMEELRLMLDANEGEEASYLQGEWLLLSSFKDYPCLQKMTETLRKAATFFQGRRSRVILPAVPWWFGNHSPFSVFHIQPGQADQEAGLLEEYITIYARLTGGHGSGADALFRAELAYNRGDLKEAEIFAHKAAYLADRHQQSTIFLGAMLRLAEIALHKADAAGWQRAVSSMDRATSFARQGMFVTQSVIEIARGVLLNELHNQANIADWLKKGELFGEQLLPEMIDNALFVYLSYLMHKGEYAQLVGTAQAFHNEAVLVHLFRELVFSLTVAVGELELDNPSKAAVYVKRAIAAAVPDRLLFPLASYTWLLRGLTEDLITKEYPALLQKFTEIKQRYLSGWTVLHRVIYTDVLLFSLLSPREQEVAKLAAEGLRNKEIAARLKVTENTVRAHLRVIFQKLEIDRRAKLAEKLRNSKTQ